MMGTDGPLGRTGISLPVPQGAALGWVNHGPSAPAEQLAARSPGRCPGLGEPWAFGPAISRGTTRNLHVSAPHRGGQQYANWKFAPLWTNSYRPQSTEPSGLPFRIWVFRFVSDFVLRISGFRQPSHSTNLAQYLRNWKLGVLMTNTSQDVAIVSLASCLRWCVSRTLRLNAAHTTKLFGHVQGAKLILPERDL
jgi:hypothetical protein